MTLTPEISAYFKEKGRKGGKVKSEAKKKAALANLEKARATKKENTKQV